MTCGSLQDELLTTCIAKVTRIGRNSPKSYVSDFSKRNICIGLSKIFENVLISNICFKYISTRIIFTKFELKKLCIAAFEAYSEV